tara:strand:+ start:5942 stop:7636 length:1695 start_codon:yes stop_codon:yes gene_type:complete
MVKFVTSFSADGFERYARKMLLSVIENWKDDLKLIAYYHDFTDDLVKELPESDKIEYRNLDNIQDMKNYKQLMKLHDGTEGGKIPYNWRMDAIKWCNKVYALTDLSLEISEQEARGGWLIWLDADTVTTKPFSEERVLRLFKKGAELVHLGRKDIDYSETSFIAFNLDYLSPHYLLADLRGCYDIGEVTAYREWHDGFIFERLLKIYIAHGLRVQNLSQGAEGLAAFAQSPLSQYMIHYKGNLKNNVEEEEEVGTIIPAQTSAVDTLDKTLPRKVPIVIKPKDSVPKETIVNNINENLKILDKWDMVRSCNINDEHAIIVSGGPSLDISKLKYLARKTKGKIICVKHSYPALLKAGIKPWACVILDPRPVEGTSTHGIVRSTLFDKVDPSTKFFVASMTDPSVTKLLKEKTDNIYGWHAFSQAIKDSIKTKEDGDALKANIGDDATFVTGGTCAAMRAIGMMHIFGFRNFHLFGFDCCAEGELAAEELSRTMEDGKKKYMRVETNGYEFWTTGELLAMAQDCEKLFNNKDIEMNINVYGEGTLVSEVFKNSLRSQKTHYMDNIK